MTHRRPGRSVQVAGVGEVDDAVAESVLAEVPVKGEDRLEAFCVDQREGRAVREAEILVRVANEGALCLVRDVVRGEGLGAAGFESSGDAAGRRMEGIITIQEGEETAAVNEHPHPSGCFQPYR